MHGEKVEHGVKRDVQRWRMWPMMNIHGFALCVLGLGGAVAQRKPPQQHFTLVQVVTPPSPKQQSGGDGQRTLKVVMVSQGSPPPPPAAVAVRPGSVFLLGTVSI